MQIRFENRLEDALAFHRYHKSISPALKRTRRGTLLYLVVLLWLTIAVLATTTQDPLLLVTIGAACTAYIAILLYRSGSSAGDRITRQLLAEGQNKSLYGWHELELEGDELTRRSLYVTSIMDLRLIEKIVETPDYAFLYISAVNALVIPRRDVAEEEYEEFIDALRARWGALRRRTEMVD